jgi:drug/metabolite transporter (DMT)-like permease
MSENLPTSKPINAPLTRRPLDLAATCLVLGLCIVWGFQQVAMKSVSSDIAPTVQLAIRFAGASVFFALVVLRQEGGTLFDDGALRSGTLLGLLFSCEFILVGQALTLTTAAHTVVFLYSAPIFTALGMQFLPEERLSRAQWCGVVLAFLGIAVAFMSYSSRPVIDVLTGDLFALLGGAAWGASNVVLRRGRISHASTAKVVLYQVLIAAVTLGGFAYATDQVHVTWSTMAITAVLFQTVVISIISYLIWFRLLRHYMTSRLMLLSLLTPLFGVMFGHALLGDTIESRFGTGAILVLIGILIVNGRLLFQRGP